MPRLICRLVALVSLIGVTEVVAAADRNPCDEGRGIGILRCSENRLGEAKKEMNEAMASLRKILASGQIKGLNTSQKHWLRYAASYCSVAGNPFPNSPNDLSEQIYWNDASYNYCLMGLTQERTANLVRLLNCIKDGGSENCS